MDKAHFGEEVVLFLFCIFITNLDKIINNF